jgi:uncharacterized protein (DUF2147 family)
MAMERVTLRRGLRFTKFPTMARANYFGLGLLLTALVALPAAAADGPSPEGFWVMKGYVIQVERCGAGICGQLVGLKPGRNPATALDRKNPDPQRRVQLLCGLKLFGGFKQSQSDRAKWEGGWIYNPDDGRTYSSEFRVEPNVLKVRGYFLTPIIGKTVSVVRETTPASRCPQFERSTSASGQQANNAAPEGR